jgi:myo-inositol-1(or 4)-monophosphatase
VTNFKGISEPVCAAQVLAGNDALHSRLHKIVAAALK